MAAKSTKPIKKTPPKKKPILAKITEKTKVTAIGVNTYVDTSNSLDDEKNVLSGLIERINGAHSNAPNTYLHVSLLHLQKALRMLERAPITQSKSADT